MKPHFFPRGLRFLRPFSTLIILLMFCGAFGQIESAQYKTYAVIGAFTREDNANRLVGFVKQYDMSATIRENGFRGLYYVYIDESYNKKEIVDEVLQLRENHTQFYDAWAYTGDFTDKPKVSSTKLNPANENIGPEKKDVAITEVVEEPGPENPVVEPGTEVLISAAPKPVKKTSHYYLYFNTINSKNLKEVIGDINIIDPERAKQLMEAKSHELIELPDPENGTKKIQLETDLFGFRKIQHVIDLDDLKSLEKDPVVSLMGDSIVVDFDLQRYRKGDVIVMYNVYFFKDAAIMKPGSVYELNSLLDMLRENENLMVKIHGHTNGNSVGKIIHLDTEDKDYFDIGGEHRESTGSAKKLSLYRAYTIQQWLVGQGVSEKRMEIKGWGGKKMIYDKFSTQADKNVRVEIEILEE